MVIALFMMMDSTRCRRAAFAYPPARRSERIAVTEPFDIYDGDFVRVKLTPKR